MRGNLLELCNWPTMAVAWDGRRIQSAPTSLGPSPTRSRFHDRTSRAGWAEGESWASVAPCFKWAIRDQWEEDYQSHPSAMTSKECVTITYCYKLIRPVYCPFYLSNKALPTSRRVGILDPRSELIELCEWASETKLLAMLWSTLSVPSFIVRPGPGAIDAYLGI